MSIYLIDKIKHANGTDPVADAQDIEMRDGTRLEDAITELRSKSHGMATLTRAQYDALAGAGALNESGHYMIVKVQAAYRPTGLEEHQMAILAGSGLLPEE